MRVMLIKDVYKLGRAGDVKKVADGYGRNFLIPQGLAVLATAGALKQVERIKGQAEIRRAALNTELQGVADQINGLALDFVVKAGETGKLYGSVTTQDVALAVTEKIRFEVKRQQVDMQPVREIGEYVAHVRLTMDLVPEIKITVRREGEAVEEKAEEEKPKARGKKAKAEAEAPVAETPAAEPEAPAG
ncbi:MAG: 50S ribosomal protein L9 [Anaerolineales bacterium]|nr:50S ribosomal protein L9 [Anaerolineales bacterium]MCZ2289467.1 50S ribosomal protein L9 [Anaerolineales bacterium]OQY85147.1 MAG: 50S ribosomal protein L9 [Anaerolineae bacterium UTCFX3]